MSSTHAKLIRVPILCLGLFLVASLLYWAGQSLRAGAAPAQAAPVLTLADAIRGFSQPVYITHAGDGSGRLFVVEQSGLIRIVKNGQILSTPFLDIKDRVRSPASGGGSEEGLLSVAFPPGYATKGRFYVYYVNRDGNLVIARYRVSNNPDQADAASEQTVLPISHPGRGNHNGGQLAFGPDGFLYIGTGDGGGGGDPDGNGQKRTTLLGKLLRIDVETGEPATYTIPAGNPFSGTADRGEIWAYGLRNPWRFSFDRAAGDLYLADVGQNAYEEVNFQPARQGGQNYGWNILEGTHCFNATSCNRDGLTLPVVEYGRSDGCSVTGGFVYRGAEFPRMQGLYFYSDYCSGVIWGFRVVNGAAAEQSPLLDTNLSVSTFGEDEAGNLYIADHADGVIYRLTDAVRGQQVYVPLVGK